MKDSVDSKDLRLALTVGAISGIRSLGGLRHVLAENRTVRRLYWAEIVADQLPFIPSRTESPSLAGRAALGAYAASTFGRAPKARWKLAAIGAVAALASTFAITALRKRAADRGALANSLAGLMESGAVSLIGERMLRAAA